MHVSQLDEAASVRAAMEEGISLFVGDVGLDSLDSLESLQVHTLPTAPGTDYLRLSGVGSILILTPLTQACQPIRHSTSVPLTDPPALSSVPLL